MLTTARLRGACARSARTIELSFFDGSSRRVDVAPLWRGPVFAEISGGDDAFVELFFDAELGTVCWPNGADIAPETLAGLPGRRDRLTNWRSPRLDSGGAPAGDGGRARAALPGTTGSWAAKLPSVSSGPWLIESGADSHRVLGVPEQRGAWSEMAVA